MTTTSAFTEFRRASVSDQAAGVLREAIRQGVWRDVLPGEHELARRLNISRPSIRAALTLLAEDHIITISKGRRTRIDARRRDTMAGAPPTICLVVPASRDSIGMAGHPVLMEMRAQFAVLGVGWEEVFDRALGGRHPESRLAGIVNGRRHVCWLLLGASATIQRWFQQAGVPALVLGSCHSGIVLPSVDVDYHAIGWHASGCLAKTGHRRVAVVLPHRPLAGDLACLQGLVRYGGQRSDPLSVVQLAAGPSRAGFFAKLDDVLSKDPRPTALFCIHVEHALMVLVRLLREGWKVPQEVSLLCRETSTSVDLGLSELTRYQSPAVKQAHQTVRVAQSMLAGHDVPTKPHLIIPAFIPGGTLAQAPQPGP